jgi:hypothetical protein
MPTPSQTTSEDLLLAYRQAKVDVFYERSNHDAIAFAEYERDLLPNLEVLRHRLNNGVLADSSNEWGGYAYLPKSLPALIPKRPDDNFNVLDSSLLGTWGYDPKNIAANQAPVQFRLVCIASVHFHVLSALWILKVGYLYDRALPTAAYGCRLRPQRGSESFKDRASRRGTFPHYSSAYLRWRKKALDRARHHLSRGKHLTAMTLDLRAFYHSVDPTFLLSPAYLSFAHIDLSPAQRALTEQLLAAIRSWCASTPDHESHPIRGLPVGLSCSKVIANAALLEFDHAIITKLVPIYYGRYVDDIIIVLTRNKTLKTGSALWNSIFARVGSLLAFDEDTQPPSVRVTLPLAPGSDLVFSGHKQKIFFLDPLRGLDVIRVLSDQIAAQTSGWRLLPELPSNETGWYKELIATSKAAEIEVDNLRKIDAVSIKRNRFATMLASLESLERQLATRSWRRPRAVFYQFLLAHVLTPAALFEFAPYLVRALELAFACEDYAAATRLIRRLHNTIGFLEIHSRGDDVKSRYLSFREYVARALIVSLARVTGLQRNPAERVRSMLRLFGVLARSERLLPTVPTLLSIAVEVATRDLARAPVKWTLLERPPVNPVELSKATSPTIEDEPTRVALHIPALERIRSYLISKVSPRSSVSLDALVFPTRPFALGEITLLVPELLVRPKLLRLTVKALRDSFPIYEIEAKTSAKGFIEVSIGGVPEDTSASVALPCVFTSDESWYAAASGTPNLSFARLMQLHAIVNEVIRCTAKPRLLVLPELAIPRKWGFFLARALGRHGISVVAGLEYEHWKEGAVSNQALVSLVIGNAGFFSQVMVAQEKRLPALDEEKRLRAHRKKLTPKVQVPARYIFRTPALHFSVLICSELTDITSRSRLRGEIDALVVIEWNRDVNSFSTLVEASALDVHCFVIQSNNRQYGDCRIRVPHKDEWSRDSVKIKGGVEDYLVVDILRIQDLRIFQSKLKSPKNGPYKPVPDGFHMAASRFAT